MAKKRKKRIWLYVLGLLILALISFIVYYNIVVKINPPTELDPRSMGYDKVEDEAGLRTCRQSWSRINDHGLGELYVQGGPLELGIMHGILLEDYIQLQEEAFVDQIKDMIPSASYLKFLRYFLAWFNKELDTYIKQEYLLEIYGVSAYASENFGFIGHKYDRILNYHAAHDIGHALQNMNLVACTAFGVWDERSTDSSLLIGRNFDFYVGDDFAKHKFIAFVEPEKGFKFAHITWAGMIGVVSGMNETGLSITLNSAKSEMPLGARTPVSIIAREILQYASNINEALAIASSRDAFVSESFLIGSANDNKVVVIEKTSDTTVLYDPDTNFIILTNHFQSEHFMQDHLNIENMQNETSIYRHERVEELLMQKETFDYSDAAVLLRDRGGKNGRNIGNGNEKSINQLIAHHSVIFKPEDKKIWVSSGRYQTGAYLCYDLDSVFAKNNPVQAQWPLYIEDLEIPPDVNFGLSDLVHYDLYKFTLKEVIRGIEQKDTIATEHVLIPALVPMNPEFYYTYDIIGQYFQETGNIELAKEYYNLALSKEISSATAREQIKERLNECLVD